MSGSREEFLPSGWSWCHISQLTSQDGLFVDGDWVETKDQDPSGDVRLIQIADIGENRFNDKSDRHLTRGKARELGCTFLRKGDVLISRLPDPLGRACIFPFDKEDSYVTAVDVSIVRLSGLINRKWFAFTFNSPRIREQVAHFKTGTTRGRISRKNLAKVRIPLPPANEQRRIVTKLEELFSELDQSVANLKTARAQLQTYRQSLLKQAFEGRLTEQWRRDHADDLESADRLLERIREERQDRYQERLKEWEAEVAQWEADGKPGKKPRKPKMPKGQLAPAPEQLEVLPLLPDGWQWVRLGEAAEVAGGLTKNPKRQALETKRPFLRVGNVYANRLELAEVHEIGVEEGELEKVSLEPGDLLVVEGNGSVDQIGRVAIWDGSIPGAVHQNHLIRARPVSVLQSTFALWFLLSKQGRDHVMRVASSTSGLHTLSLSKVENLLVPLCCTEEQQRVVDEVAAKLSEVDETEKAIETTLQQTQTLRQSILKRAFEGRLVPQDPNDEPAADLLARIRREAEPVAEEEGAPA